LTGSGFEPDGGLFIEAERRARGKILRTRDPQEAVAGADVIYSDTWISMGQERDAAFRRVMFSGYQLNDELLSLAKDDAVFMHCLPAHRGEEVTDSVIDGAQSIVVEQAENRLHLQKALMLELVRANEARRVAGRAKVASVGAVAAGA
jgi:ornithine carbamoyltransferase